MSCVRMLKVFASVGLESFISFRPCRPLLIFPARVRPLPASQRLPRFAAQPYQVAHFWPLEPLVLASPIA